MATFCLTRRGRGQHPAHTAVSLGPKNGPLRAFITPKPCARHSNMKSPFMRRPVLVALLSLLAAAAPVSGQTKLLLFGGPGHDTYLGCLTCSEYSAESVFNEYGHHGSRYSSASIRNRHGQFGSGYSQYSACNRYASDPPVLVDEEGGAYGRLTLNRYHPQAIDDSEIMAWLQSFCEN